MLRRHLKCNQGITMGMVLIIMSVLSILGIATLSLALSAYRLQMSDKRIKSTFYVADSELDQAYGLISIKIKAAISEGNVAVNQEVQTEIETEREDAILNPTTHVAHWLKSDGTVDEGYLTDQLANSPILLNKMQDAYKAYLGDESQSHISESLTTTGNYKQISEASPDPDIISIILGTITNFIGDPSKPMVIPLQYKVIHDAGKGDQEVTQQVSAEFNIQVPPKIIGYQTAVNSIPLQDQPLWRTALASYNNIDLSGPNIKVSGDVFAKGYLPTDPTDLKDLTLFGGISAGKASESTNVTINGNAYSDANVQVNSSNTNLKVTGSGSTGNVFSDNLVLQGSTSHSKIEVGQDAYTRDDIEIKGTAANLLIDGNFNGYSGGEAGHDKSSSIVINSPDINSAGGSSVQVAGNSFLAGTVYVNAGDPGDPDYQTGESVSIDGNYRAYGYLPGKVTYGSYDPVSDKNNNQYTFRKVGDSLMLIDTVNEKDFSVLDKAQHFFNVYQEMASFLSTGYTNPNNHDNSSIIFGGSVLSTGAFIQKGTIQPSDYNIDTFAATQVACQSAVQTNVTDNFGHGQVTANTAGYDLQDRVNTGSLFTERNNILQVSPTFNEVLATSPDHDIWLIGAGFDPTGVPADAITVNAPSSGVFGGLVLTAKNVFIRGKVDFHGSVIAGKDINVTDTYDKNFSADENLVKQIIASNNLNDLFVPPAGTATSLFNFDAGGGVPDPVINPDYLTIKNWKKL
ncbi:MAG: hypothetical protein P4L59_15265 [Desulfosporosinus sp.]|nr:hypothetical protein [Desulfosporosinus sp.]